MTEILLSTYNGAKYLSQQLDSLLQQTDRDWTLVVRDDGSTDETKTILQHYQKQFGAGMRIMEDGMHVGSLRSFERLLAASKADYCMFADQDDVWLNEKVTHARQCMARSEAETGPEVPTVVYSDLTVTDEHLQVLGSYREMVKLRPDLLLKPEQMAVNNYVTGCTAMINRAAIKVSLPFGEHALVHDAVIGLAVAAAGGRIVDIGVSDIRYRQHADNVVGAIEVRSGWAYWRKKIKGIKTVCRQQYANYKQARDIIAISPSKFVWNRCMYLIKR
jgi:GT2 family glycosyltransferase